MSGPWEQYAAAPSANSGPWSKYGPSSTPSAAAPQKPHDLSLGEVSSGAIQNMIPSAANTGKAMVQPLLHPIDTATGIANTAMGEVEKVATPFITPGHHGEHEKYANALNSYFGDRYGSMEGFKKAVATDPVGVGADISSLLTFGGGALARAPGIVGKAGQVVSKAGAFSNPLALTGKAAKAVAPLGADIIGYLGTHTGADAIKLAAKSGAIGGTASAEFLKHMRGNAPIGDIVNSAKNAVSQLRNERKVAYQAGMKGVSQDKTVLDFNDIDAHIAKTNTVKNFKGQDLSPETAAIRKKIANAITAWKKLDPKEFHTVEGMDAFKQQIGSLRDSLDYHSPERLIADTAYHAIRETITKQAPTYAKVMKDYEDASKELEEMQKTLSLNPKASVDTAARKLLSILRNNVNTNFGRRKELGKVLEQHGAPNLPYQLAGETLSPPFPTSGFGRAEGGLGAIAAIALHQPALLGALPFMMPRVVGEVAHGVGKVAGNPAVRHIPQAALVSRALGGMNTSQDVASQLQP